MKAGHRILVLLLALAGFFGADPRGVAAADEDSGGAGEVPLACDGGLCDTTNSAECTLGRGGRLGAPARGTDAGALAAALLLGAWRWRHRVRARKQAALAGAGAALVLMPPFAGRASAESEVPVDVAVHEPPPPHRAVALEWNPLAIFTVGKWSANIVLVPAEHHALVLSPFYARATTSPIYVYDDNGNATQLPEQSFAGFGSEVGYHYYVGPGGPRGFFFGPALILGSFTATGMNGERTRFIDYGVAIDAGCELLVSDAVAVSLGAGLQLTTTSKSIPHQQFDAKIYANRILLPRLLLSVGWAI